MVEAHIFGVLLAPIVIYVVVAASIFGTLRMMLGRSGILGHVWHKSLFELAVFFIILSCLVLFL